MNAKTKIAAFRLEFLNIGIIVGIVDFHFVMNIAITSIKPKEYATHV